MDKTAKHYPLSLISPSFDSPLTGLIMELEHLRRLQLSGTTPSRLFAELKAVFHLLESVGSARIEGNNTTIAEYLDSKAENAPSLREQEREILNVENALLYIEDYVGSGYPINETFVKSLHQMVVDGLTREGDVHAGTYRPTDVRISGSQHIPPGSSLVPSYMDELFAFLEHEDPAHFDLIKISLAHHRFVWIHPFANGNGRTVRLFTYALLLRYGFGGSSLSGRIIHPTAIFCSDRGRYYEMLSRADRGDAEELLQWCEYVLGGLRQEVEKVGKLCDYGYVGARILAPALAYAERRGVINHEEHQILSLAGRREEIQNSDVASLLPGHSSATISRKIKDLVSRKMLAPIGEGKRKYALSLGQSPLLRGIMYALDQEGFLPIDGGEVF